MSAAVRSRLVTVDSSSTLALISSWATKEQRSWVSPHVAIRDTCVGLGVRRTVLASPRPCELRPFMGGDATSVGRGGRCGRSSSGALLASFHDSGVGGASAGGGGPWAWTAYSGGIRVNWSDKSRIMLVRLASCACVRACAPPVSPGRAPGAGGVGRPPYRPRRRPLPQVVGVHAAVGLDVLRHVADHHHVAAGHDVDERRQPRILVQQVDVHGDVVLHIALPHRDRPLQRQQRHGRVVRRGCWERAAGG